MPEQRCVQDFFHQGQIPLLEGTKYLHTLCFCICPLCPPWELFSSGAETYYFEYYQGHMPHGSTCLSDRSLKRKRAQSKRSLFNSFSFYIYRQLFVYFFKDQRKKSFKRLKIYEWYFTRCTKMYNSLSLFLSNNVIENFDTFCDECSK